MSGNTFGTVFKVTTWGESHGNALGVVVDGTPAGLPLHTSVIQKELDRRRPGQSSSSTSRNEADTVEILSGVFEGRTTGMPISMMVRNKDANSSAYEYLRAVPRPGHADLFYRERYGVRDHRGGGDHPEGKALEEWLQAPLQNIYFPSTASQSLHMSSNWVAL